jgi:D-alanyl-D-alanine dipeptidase
VNVRVWVFAVASVACTQRERVDEPPVEAKAVEQAKAVVVTPAPPQPAAPKPPEGLVDLHDHVADLRLSIGYATAANFTGAPLPGYEHAGAWAHPDLAKALGAVDRELAADGLGLLVYDAYRPVRATAAMVEWTRVNNRGDLLKDGYISAKSQHNRGLAIDLTLVDRETGTLVDMGGAWDTFDRSSAAFAAKGEALANRKRLRAVMTKHGFVPHDGEWWHFSLPHPSAPVKDVPYGP